MFSDQVLSSPSPSPTASVATKPTPTPIPSILPPDIGAPALPSELPNLPDISELDQAFEKSDLGKEAEENRYRVELRKLKNQVAQDEEIRKARKTADRARTDLERRRLRREYYELYYGRMRGLASSEGLKRYIDRIRDGHIATLAQPRVRPSSAAE